MNDIAVLAALNERFIDACRAGSWLMLEPILSPSFGYLDGLTGEKWDINRYITDLVHNPAPGLTIDQVAIHVDGDAAIVSARSHNGPKRSSRYIDTYQRRNDSWLCVHACVWPLKRP